jgi:uncharacterized lipoprotein YddW (UPF0748 family)
VFAQSVIAAAPLDQQGVRPPARQTGQQPGPWLRQLARTTTIQPSDEIRALWVVRDALTSPRDVDRCVDFAVLARFQMIFVQVRGRGDAYYRSAHEPPGDQLRYTLDDFDPLQYLLTRAHDAGLSVHAWCNIFYVWSSEDLPVPQGHVVLSHPEWLLTTAGGERMDERPVDEWKAAGIEGYFLSPFSVEARAYTADVIGDLVDKYPVDGIHLDYIRFPGAGYGFDPETRTRFALEWGVDPAALNADPAGVAAVMGQAAYAVMDSVWLDRRAAAVDSMVLAIRETIGTLPLSAAVVPDAPVARAEKGQDWVSWVRRRWVDFVVPMAYNHRPDQLLDWARVLHNTIGRERSLVGLAVHDGRDQYLDRAVNILRVEGVAGFSIFSYNVLAQHRFAAGFVEQVFFPPEPEPEEPDGEPEQNGAEEDDGDDGP